LTFTIKGRPLDGNRVRATLIEAVMGTQYSDGARFANCFQTDAPPFVLTKPLPRGGMVAARLTYSRPAHGPARIPAQSAFVVLSLMRDLACSELEIDGRSRLHSVLRNGEVAVFDLRYATVIDVQTPFDFVYLYIPHSALDRLADEYDAPRIVECNMQPGVSVPDPVITHLAVCLERALAGRDRASEVLTEHVALALQMHFVQHYAGMRIRSESNRGALAAWQLRLAKEMLTAHLDSPVSIAHISKECGLSASHFARAFKCSTGMSPHRWLVDRRIEKAADLLHHSTLSVAEIAQICGFFDQSHLTRVFESAKGATPGRWRRGRLTDTNSSTLAPWTLQDLRLGGGSSITWRDEPQQS
jgi:AraC family transcriptional regulator